MVDLMNKLNILTICFKSIILWQLFFLQVCGGVGVK